MKKQIKLLVLFFTIFAGNFSYSQNSILVLKMWDNSYFNVHFNNREYSTANILKTTGLFEGRYKLTVYRRLHNGKETIIFNDFVDIPYNSIVRTRINKYNQLIIKNIEPVNNNNRNGHRRYSDNYNGGYYRRDRPYNDNYNNGGYRDNYHNHHNYNNNRRDNRYDNSNNFDFSGFKQSLTNENFDSNKLEIAKQTISKVQFSSDEIYQILMLFSFESSRLDFAKYAYRYCYDQVNYYKINNAFTFSSSIRELRLSIDNR